MKKLSMILLLAFLPCAVNAQDLLYFPHDSTWIDVMGGGIRKQESAKPGNIMYVIVDGLFLYLDGIATNDEVLKYIPNSISSALIETDVSTAFRFFINSPKGSSSVLYYTDNLIYL